MSSISSRSAVVRVPRPLAVAGALPGVALAVAVAAGATALSAVVGLGSGPVLGIVLGLCVGTAIELGAAGHLSPALRGSDAQRAREPRGPAPRGLVPRGPAPGALAPGVRWAASVPLRAAVVVLGAELPLGAVLGQGARSLPGIVVTLGGCLLLARALGRRLGIRRRLRALVGAGTAICGASAIAALTPVIDAEETDVGYAVATIFLFNVLAVLLFPLVGHALGLGPHDFGVFAGTAVNDLSSVVAAATLYGAGSLHTAVVVKLTRTLMIVPICIVLGRRFRPGGEAARSARTAASAGAAGAAGAAASAGATRTATSAGATPAAASAGATPAAASAGATRAAALARAARVVPGFLVLFALTAGLRGAGVIPASWAGGASQAATLLITLALSAVGLSVDLGALRRAGLRPLALGAALWVAVSLLSLGCQAVGLL